MHGFAIVLLTKEMIQHDKLNLVFDIEDIVYDYKNYFHKNDERLCSCVVQNSAPNPSCLICQGTGKTRHNVNGRFDYWLLGGRFDGYIRNGKPDPEKIKGNFLLELLYMRTAKQGLLFHEEEHDEVEANVIPVEQIHQRVLRENWIIPDHGWIEDIVTLTDNPREAYKNYWAAGIDFHH